MQYCNALLLKVTFPNTECQYDIHCGYQLCVCVCVCVCVGGGGLFTLAVFFLRYNLKLYY